MALDLALVMATLEARLADVLPFMHNTTSVLADLVNGFVAWAFEDAFRIRNCFSASVAHTFVSSCFGIREKGNVFRASLKLALNEVVIAFIASGDPTKEARGKNDAVHHNVQWFSFCVCVVPLSRCVGKDAFVAVIIVRESES
jgi:hypothetical protein